jgi:SPP1 gp7 family putative phage head morphogenesis protein
MSCTHDTLASYTRDGSYGPTRTKTVTQRFEQNLRGALRRINAAIKRAVIEEDIFGLANDGTDTLAVDSPPPLRTENNARKTVLFIQWLREQLDTGLLEVVQRNENPYIRSAYAQGIRLATSQLQERGIDPATVDIAEIVEQGNFNRGLQVLFTRTYDFLEDTADELVREVRDELMEGFSRGESPREMADRISDRVDSVGKSRATMIARTEIIHAHSEAAVQRYEDVSERQDANIGLRHVGRLTANDARVCPACRRLEDSVFTFDEFRSATFEFRGTVYRVGIPSHPHGRCAPMPQVGVDLDGLPPLSERVPGTLITS